MINNIPGSVVLELRIDFSDLDYFGHVNNVSFFKYVQAARVNYWDNVGITDIHKETGIGPMLVSCHCEFKKPLFYPGKLKIYTKTEFIRNSSFCFTHRLLNDAGETCAEATDVMVMFDFKKHEKIRFPAELKAIMEKIENKNF